MTLEFGSYLLEQRNASQGRYLPGYFKAYGITPCSLLVNIFGPRRIDLYKWFYARSDVANFFSHLAFEIGEPHTNKNIRSLVDALYRYIGLKPDPPDEFTNNRLESDDDGFGLIEINVRYQEIQES